MLKGEKINLRLIQKRDLEEYIALESDLDIRGEFVPHRVRSEVGFKKRFEETGFWSDDGGTMLIVSKDDQILGQIAFFKPARYFDALELGYVLYHKASRGKGYTSEAVRLFSRYLFATKKINRLQLGVSPENIASRRVAEKSGYVSEGILRGAIYFGGKNHDVEMFGLLRSDMNQEA